MSERAEKLIALIEEFAEVTDSMWLQNKINELRNELRE